MARRAAAAAAAVFAASSSAAAAAPPPLGNVLVLLADDQGWGDVGYNAVADRQFIPGAGGRVWTPNPPRTPVIDALARDDATLVFDRFYSGSPVCSPTRASLLSGRTPDRECVFNAEGCGQEPAWSCVNPEPFPPVVPTAAAAFAAAGFATLHTGKFHLGDFFPKDNPTPSYAYRQWPVVHPGTLGFGAWSSTEASASSTMCNCGCDPAWPAEPPGCVIGGGTYVLNQSFPCTNYWSLAPGAPVPACLQPRTSTRGCVANLTAKIPGDDTVFLAGGFGAFVNASVAAGRRFFATVQLHTNHVPHPALPQFFHAYNGTDGQWAGDYLGTLTQMDAGVGVVMAALAAAGVADSTLLVYAADNGPHPGTPGDGAGGIADVLTATNGLRQCKASVFEGGIRVPGFIRWPGVITGNPRTTVPAYVPDLFPTFLDALGAPYPRPGWAVDGESLLPLISRANTSWVRSKPLGWRLGDQAAWMDPSGRWKLVRSPDAGQCALENSTYLPHNKTGPFLFDLWADPTESAPVPDGGGGGGVGPALAAGLAAWEASIAHSQVAESHCLPPNGTVTVTRAGACLAADGTATHAAVRGDAACTGAARAGAPPPPLVDWVVDDAGVLRLAANGTQCFHTDESAKDPCAAGTPVWLGPQCTDNGVTLDPGAGVLPQPGCPGMCAGVGGGGAVVLTPCTDPAATGWAVGPPAPARGVYRRPND
jgi:arylsulfatase A-like enzyme